MQVIWAGVAQPLNYCLMVAGFALYLVVGFNAAMGHPVRMREVRSCDSAAVLLCCMCGWTACAAVLHAACCCNFSASL